MTKNTINWAEHLEAARTKIKNLTADAYPIPTGPDLPTIKNISVLDLSLIHISEPTRPY